jgi:Holliday junction resolvase RusA-like endonuclease
MSAVSFTVPAVPVAYARSRHNGRQHFTPAPLRSYMAEIALFARRAMEGREPLDGPLELLVGFQRVRKPRRAQPDGAVLDTARPDLSNLIKAVEDALNGIVYGDDSQIVSILADKRVTDMPGADPCISITVRPVGDSRQSERGDRV